MIGRGYELVILALVVFVLFGAKRLPDSARAIGQSLRVFRAETQALHDDDRGEARAHPVPTAPRPVPAAPAEVARAWPAGEHARAGGGGPGAEDGSHQR